MNASDRAKLVIESSTDYRRLHNAITGAINAAVEVESERWREEMRVAVEAAIRDERAMCCADLCNVCESGNVPVFFASEHYSVADQTTWTQGWFHLEQASDHKYRCPADVIYDRAMESARGGNE